MLVQGAPCIGPCDCPSGTLWNIKPCVRPVRMYVILRGACRATLCVVPYRGFPTPVDRNNTDTNNRIDVNANTHAPINSKNQSLQIARAQTTNAIMIVVII